RPVGDLHARVAELRAAHARLQVADDVVIELDLDLVVLDVPRADGGHPAEAPRAAWHHALTAEDQRATVGRGELLEFLGCAAGDVEKLLARGLAGDDLRELLARQDDAGLALVRRDRVHGAEPYPREICPAQP